MNKVTEQKARVEAEIKKLEEMGGSLSGRAKKIRDSAFARFPVIFVMLSTFGVVATLYGFEKVIDETEFLASSPKLLLAIGILTLAITGTLYKKLN